VRSRLDRVTAETNQLGAARTFEYDAASNLKKRTDRNGRVIELTYDNLYRLTAETWKNGQTVVNTMQFGYDAASQLTTAADAYSNYTYVYDALGRVTSETWANPGAPVVQLLEKYDAASRQTELLARIDHGSGYRDDLKNTYQYDNLGRMTRVDQAGVAGGNAVAEKRVDFAYNAASQFSSITRYKDTDGLVGDLIANSAYTYDGIGRLTGLAHTRNSTTFANYTWSFDAASRVTSMNFTSLVGPNGTTSYSYDNTAQLTAADHSFQADENFSYDLNGNRTNTGYSTGTNNRLTSDGTFNYTYDAEGNRITRTRISGAQADDYLTEYTWDHHNRLTSVTFKNNQGTVTKSLQYEYDVFDRRVEATWDSDGSGPASAIVTRWVYDGADLLLVFDGAGGLYHRYLHGPGVDQILADEQYLSGPPEQQPSSPGTVLWAIADNLGTVRDVVDSTGAVLNHLTFTAFGAIVSETNPSVEFAFGFTGRERDESTGQNFHRARYYDPAVGRWLSEDPIGFAAGDTNLARYVGNGPTNARDASGLDEVKPTPIGSNNGLPSLVVIDDNDGTFVNGDPVAVGVIYEDDPELRVWRNGHSATYLEVQEMASSLNSREDWDAWFAGKDSIQSELEGDDSVGFLGWLWIMFSGEFSRANDLSRQIRDMRIRQAWKTPGNGYDIMALADEMRPMRNPTLDWNLSKESMKQLTELYIQWLASGGDFVCAATPFGLPARHSAGAAAGAAAKVTAVPSVRAARFQKWFNSLSAEQFAKLWAVKEVREIIEARLRSPGGYHEWLPVSRAHIFKKWGVTAEQIQKLRTLTTEVFFKSKGRHGGFDSTTAHNEIFKLIDDIDQAGLDNSFDAYKKALQKWADDRLVGGSSKLPPELRP
jgi:RHS repeat-associated protein